MKNNNLINNIWINILLIIMFNVLHNLYKNIFNNSTKSKEKIKSFSSYGNEHITLYTNNLDYALLDGIPYRLRSFLTDKLTNYPLFENPHEILITLLKDHKSKLNLHSQITLLLNNKNPQILDIIFDLISELNYFYNDQLNYYYLEYLCCINNDKVLNFITNNLEYMTESSWNSLCSNPNDKALELLIEHNKLNIDDYCQFKYLCANSNDKVIDIIMKHLYKFDNEEYNNKDYIYSLCFNTNPKIIGILELYKNKLDNDCWLKLLLNLNTKILDYALNNIKDINDLALHALCINTNDKALDIVRENTHLLNKYTKSELLCNHNPKALQILLEIEPNISVDTTINKYIFGNPNIWTYDYELMKQNKSKLHYELNYVLMKLKKEYLFEYVNE